MKNTVGDFARRIDWNRGRRGSVAGGSGALAALALAAVLALPAGLAGASPELVGQNLGTSPEGIKTALVEKGYEVRKIEDEDGKIEAYAIRDGVRYEIYVDPASGKVVKVETK